MNTRSFKLLTFLLCSLPSVLFQFIRRLSNPLLGQNADWEALMEEDGSQEEEGEASSRGRRRKGNAT
jgi:hypothetical protein